MSSAGASLRLVKFIKYASKQGWRFCVVTQDPVCPVLVENEHCEFLLKDIPSDVEIVRIENPIFGTSKFKSILRRIARRSSFFWGLNVLRVGRKKFKNQPFDLIFVNSPPFTNVAIGFVLSKMLHIPFIIDMKDDWIVSANYKKKRFLRRNIDLFIEYSIFKSAAKVITVTKSSLDNYRTRYPDLEKMSKFDLIPNGFDMGEFESLFSQEPKERGEIFRMATTASGYRPDYRDLSPLMDTLKIFFDHNNYAREKIEIEFIGESVDPIFKHELEQILPADKVIFSGNLDRNKMIEKMKLADLFFLIQPLGNTTAISGTLYEYWAIGKAPILLFAEYGASSDFVHQNNLGAHFFYSHTLEASKYLNYVYERFRSSQPVRINRKGIEKFDRGILAKNMMKIWSEIIKAKKVLE